MSNVSASSCNSSNINNTRNIHRSDDMIEETDDVETNNVADVHDDSTQDTDLVNNCTNKQYTSTFASTTSTRLESFTEAVPLSLSSMAHASVPLEDGVLDGIKQILHHTLLSCVHYARHIHPPHQWTFRDLVTSPFAWEPHKSQLESSSTRLDASITSVTTTSLDMLPGALKKLQFKHEYTRNALIYLQPALPPDLTLEAELGKIDKWHELVGVLGRVSLRYLTTEPLTQAEMDGTDTDDMPPCILYKTEVEYRSLPPIGNQQTTQPEELSMLSFGGSIDDDVKFGALASLYDEHAKYVLEIYSVRGKKYKFDLMDSTLSDGSVPNLPNSRQGDPSVKSLCVTVTAHDRPFTIHDHNPAYEAENKKKFAITRMNLLLEGKPRKDNSYENLPAFDFIANGIVGSFLILNPSPPQIVTAFPSEHALILDSEYAGRTYVNGRYVTTWGQDARIGCHGTALFGMDLHSIPFWHGRIIDYDALKSAYSQLWHEILVDARLMHLNVGSRLLARLMTGQEPLDKDDESELYDDDEREVSPDTDVDCLESQVISSFRFDPVGISSKALAIRFANDYGNDGFPCLIHEMEWVKQLLPDRKPVAVPQRLIPILRRGGYSNPQQTFDDLWFSDTRPLRTEKEKAVVKIALQHLEEAGCSDFIALEQIAVVSKPPVLPSTVVAHKMVCRFSEAAQLYCVHERFFVDLCVVDEYKSKKKATGTIKDDTQLRGYLLGLFLAKEHTDGKVLARYFRAFLP